MDAISSQLANIWLPDIVNHTSQYLEGNEIACSLRLVDKFTAKLFANRATVRISRPAPTHAFSQHWTRPGAFHALSYSKRRRFLALVAASGCLPNLELAMQLAGCDLTAAPYLADQPYPSIAAAAAGHIHICAWFRDRGTSLDVFHLKTAAEAGRQEMCAWLISIGCTWQRDAACAAAWGGHPELMTWLLAQRHVTSGIDRLLLAALEGCDLATCQHMHREWLVAQATGNQQWTLALKQFRDGAIAKAVGNPMPDWQAKVEWLEALGCPRSADASKAAVRCCPDALERLQWLHARGYPMMSHVLVVVAAQLGKVAVLQFLLDSGVKGAEDAEYAARGAAREGHLSALQLLHEKGWVAKKPIKFLYSALASGNVEILAWLLEAQVVTLDHLRRAADAYTNDLSVELLEWLHARACDVDEDVFSWVTRNASEAVLEWLLAHGYRFPDDGEPYKKAADVGDLITLAWLHRVGCPWGQAMLTYDARYLAAGVRAWADGLGLPYDKSKTETDEVSN